MTKSQYLWLSLLKSKDVPYKPQCVYFVPGLYGSGGIMPVEESLKKDTATAMFSTKALLNLDLVGFVASIKGRAIQQFSSELGLEPDLAMEAVAITGAIAAGLATIFPRDHPYMTSANFLTI